MGVLLLGLKPGAICCSRLPERAQTKEADYQPCNTVIEYCRVIAKCAIRSIAVLSREVVVNPGTGYFRLGLSGRTLFGFDVVVVIVQAVQSI